MNVREALPAYRGIYLTFDDGPDPEWTPRCLDALAHAHARATFFVVGAQAAKHPAIVRRIASEGHRIGNHTFSHAHPWTLSARRARAEVRDGANAIADILGSQSSFYRPPHGARRRCMEDEAAACGEHIVMWDVSAIDWGWLGTALRIAKRLARVREGNIVLLHDGANKHNRPGAMLRVLPEFLERRRVK